MTGIQPLKAPPYLFPYSNPKDMVHIAMVVCGNRQAEALTLVKSAMIFTPTNLHIHAVVEAKLWKAFDKTVLLLIVIIHQHNCSCHLSMSVFALIIKILSG